MRLIVAFLVGLVLLFIGIKAQDVEAHHFAKQSGIELKEKFRGCRRLGWPRSVKCEVRRAAIHYGQPPSLAIRVAYCESKWRPRTDAHYEGLFQFLWSTWRTTPYAKRSPYSAKWNSLGAMWMWKAGRADEWGKCL